MVKTGSSENFFRVLGGRSKSATSALMLWAELKRCEDGKGFKIHFLDREVSFQVKVRKK